MLNELTAIKNIKNGLIDRILATKNEKLLQAITTIFESAQVEEKVALSSEQLEMLAMSEDDIVNGRLISEEELDKFDAEFFSKE